MGYKQPSYIQQTWWIIKYAVQSWFEWQDAKEWAKIMHPSWVQIATHGKTREIRETYRNKILNIYRENY